MGTTTTHYDMCKKIAQLTKVVYKLNTLNEDHDITSTAKEEAHKAMLVNQLTKDASNKLNSLRQVCVEKTTDLEQLKALYTLEKDNALKEMKFVKESFQAAEARLKSQYKKKIVQLEEAIQVKANEELMVLEKIKREKEDVDNLRATEKRNFEIEEQRLELEKQNDIEKLEVSHNKALEKVLDEVKCNIDGCKMSLVDHFQECIQSEIKLIENIIILNKDELEQRVDSVLGKIGEVDGENAVARDKVTNEINSNWDKMFALVSELYMACSENQFSSNRLFGDMTDSMENIESSFNSKLNHIETTICELSTEYSALKACLEGGNMKGKEIESKVCLLEKQTVSLAESRALHESKMDGIFQAMGNIEERVDSLPEYFSHSKNTLLEEFKRLINERLTENNTAISAVDNKLTHEINQKVDELAHIFSSKVSSVEKYVQDVQKESVSSFIKIDSVEESLNLLKESQKEQGEISEKKISSVCHDLVNIDTELKECLNNIKSNISSIVSKYDAWGMRLTEAEKSMLNVEKKAKELIVQSQSYCSKECDSIKINFEGQLISLRGKCVCIDEKLEQHSQRLNILMDESERANRSSSSQCEKLGKRHDELAIGLDEKDQKLRALEKEVTALISQVKMLESDSECSKKFSKIYQRQLEELVNNLEGEHTMFREKSDILEKKIDEAVASSGDSAREMKDEIEQVQALFDILDSRNNDVLGKMDLLNSSVNMLKQDHDELSSSVSRYVEKGGETLDKVNQLRLLSKTLGEKLSHNTEALNFANTTFSQFQSETRQRFDDLELHHSKGIKDLRNNMENKLKCIISDCSSTTEALKIEMVTKEKEMKLQIDDIRSTFNKLLNAQNDQHRQELRMMSEHISGVANSTLKLKEANEALKKRLTTETNSSRKLKADLENCGTTLEKQQTQADTEKKEIRDEYDKKISNILKDNRTAMDKIKEDYSTELESAKREIGILLDQLRSRGSRPEDIERINRLEEEEKRLQAEIVATKEEMQYFRRELVNREENFNQFSNNNLANKNVGVMNVLKPTKKKSIRR